MKVKELKRLLDTLEQDRQVLLATDEEGNGFGTIDIDIGKLKYDNGGKKEPVVVLYPLHYINPDDLYLTDN